MGNRYTYKQLRLKRALHTVFWTIMLIISIAVIVYGVARFTGEAMQKGVADGGVGRYTATITLTDPLKSSENGPYSVIVTDIGCLSEETEILASEANFGTYGDIVEKKHPVLVECTDEELEELARLAFLEAGSDWISDDCIRAVVEVVFNQLNYGAWGNSLHEVIYSAGNYEPAYNIPYTEPTERCREIVRDVYENGISLPSRVMFFRAWHYHEWAGAVPEFEIDGVYFSSSWWCK